MAIDKKWFTKLQGRDYVTFPGLLDLAHQTGCVGVTTELIQIPEEKNGNVAICKATVTFHREAGVVEGDWRDQTWIAYGDASPANVNRMIATALIRMSETRAIGRALRMACNVGQTMLEELAEGTVPKEERLQPGDPQVIPMQCEVCGEDVPPEELGTSRYRFKGIYCARHRMEMDNAAAEPPLACTDCGTVVSKKIADASLQSKWATILCLDCGRARKAQEKEAVAA